jgi:ribosomal protein S7
LFVWGVVPFKKRHEKRAAKKRPLLPDPRFNDQLVTFVDNLMWMEKKSTAFKYFMMQLTSLSLRNKMQKTIIRNMER